MTFHAHNVILEYMIHVFTNCGKLNLHTKYEINGFEDVLNKNKNKNLEKLRKAGYF